MALGRNGGVKYIVNGRGTRCRKRAGPARLCRSDPWQRDCTLARRRPCDRLRTVNEDWGTTLDLCLTPNTTLHMRTDVHAYCFL